MLREGTGREREIRVEGRGRRETIKERERGKDVCMDEHKYGSGRDGIREARVGG